MRHASRNGPHSGFVIHDQHRAGIASARGALFRRRRLEFRSLRDGEMDAERGAGLRRSLDRERAAVIARGLRLGCIAAGAGDGVGEVGVPDSVAEWLASRAEHPGAAWVRETNRVHRPRS